MHPRFTLLTLALANLGSCSRCSDAKNAEQNNIDGHCDNDAECSDACNNAITSGADIENALKIFSICDQYKVKEYLATMKESIAHHNSECGTTIPFTLTYQLVKAAAGNSKTGVIAITSSDPTASATTPLLEHTASASSTESGSTTPTAITTPLSDPTASATTPLLEHTASASSTESGSTTPTAITTPLSDPSAGSGSSGSVDVPVNSEAEAAHAADMDIAAARILADANAQKLADEQVSAQAELNQSEAKDTAEKDAAVAKAQSETSSNNVSTDTTTIVQDTFDTQTFFTNTQDVAKVSETATSVQQANPVTGQEQQTSNNTSVYGISAGAVVAALSAAGIFFFKKRSTKTDPLVNNEAETLDKQRYEGMERIPVFDAGIEVGSTYKVLND